MSTRERVVINEYLDERDIPTREPGVALIPWEPTQPENDNEEWAGVGPARGEYEARRAGSAA